MVLKELWDLYWCPMRLSVRQKMKLALLLGYLAHAEQKDDCETGVHIEMLSEHRRNAIPEHIGIFEESDEEEDDPTVSDETAARIAELVAACKELQLKATDYFGSY